MLAYSGREWMNTVSLDLNAHIRDQLKVMRSSVPAEVQIELLNAEPAISAVIWI